MPSNQRATDSKATQEKKRRRVNHMKHMIIAGAVLLLLTSVVLNIVLVFKVLHLEGKLDQLYSDTTVTVMMSDRA